ncbi:hypothetical protein ABKA04_009310 [Annulohypoxylon sp. FPYF3050]
MSNGSTAPWQPTFATTITISVGTGSPSDRGIGALTTAPAVANLSSIATGASSPEIQTPVVFSSVPWSTDDDPSLPTVTTIWPWPNNGTPPDASSSPTTPLSTPTPPKFTTTVIIQVNHSSMGLSSSTSGTTTSSSAFTSQSTGSPTPSSGASPSSQVASSTTVGGNVSINNIPHGGIPGANTGPPLPMIPTISTFTTSTTPTATIKVHPVTD